MECEQPIVGLVSMPWMAPTIPSIQLATLAAALNQEGIASECHELFLDYAACIGLNLYKTLSSRLGFTAEWLFAQHYFGPEMGNMLDEFRIHRRPLGMGSLEFEEKVLDVLVPVTGHFLTEALEAVDWSRYQVVGFSLTISQVASSMALARLIKRCYPAVTIVFGGAGCAGPMGKTILRVCPYVDSVVHVEGELVLPELVRRVGQGRDFEGLTGVSWRNQAGEIVGDSEGRLFMLKGDRPTLNFDAYFERLERLGMKDRLKVWLPFESSRGCWYGEKRQCTFCGLHEIMKFRDRAAEAVLAELEAWHRRYGIRRFFSVDLIMPRAFFDTFLPDVIRRGHDWTMFYEVKANMKRHEVELLAAAGVRWIQPGIESLDSETLKLMQKGVSPLQNIQLLKWCAESGIRVSWNLIYGLPGEKGDAYRRMAERMPLLFHLTPPSGAGRFQLHRFSPYFEQPEAYGIQYRGAHPLYQHVFPVSQEYLDDLVYLHDYAIDEPEPVSAYIAPIQALIAQWKEARARGATLSFQLLPDGSAEIRDTRVLPGVTYSLTPSEAKLYLSLDESTIRRTLESTFYESHPKATSELDSLGGLVGVLDRWIDQGLVMEEQGRLLALAVNAHDVAHRQQWWATLSAPLAYLEDIPPVVGN